MSLGARAISLLLLAGLGGPCAVLLAGCPGAEPGDAGCASGCDAAVSACDAHSAPDATGADLAPPAARLLQLDLHSGGAVSGELVATYDRNYWWEEPGPELLFALFEPDAFADYPLDDSVRITSSLDVAALSWLDWPADRVAYRDFLRGRGMVLARPPLDGVSYVIRGNDGYHREEMGYGDFAFDLERTDAHGARHTGDGLANSDYLVWGAPVRSPVAGFVVEVEDSAPDNSPGSYPSDAVNNLVGIHLGGSFYVYLLHLRQGSVPAAVTIDAWVDVGDALGEVGNAGVSYEPHLHLVLLWYDADASPPRSWSVPVEFADLSVAPSPSGPHTTHAYAVPATGTWISAP